MSGAPFSNVNNIHVHVMTPEDPKNIATQRCSTGRLFTAATQALNNVVVVHRLADGVIYHLPCKYQSKANI